MVVSLQWDRAFDSAEGQNSAIASRPSTRLQWDRAFDSAEGRRLAQEIQPLQRFNGTAHLIARKALAEVGAVGIHSWLQWDRAFDSAEGLLLPVIPSSHRPASMGPRI